MDILKMSIFTLKKKVFTRIFEKNNSKHNALNTKKNIIGCYHTFFYRSFLSLYFTDVFLLKFSKKIECKICVYI